MENESTMSTNSVGRSSERNRGCRRISKETIDFNKELLFGEIGALIGIQFVDFISLFFSISISLIPHLIILGAIIGGSLFWISARIYYKSKEGNYSEKKLITDVEYFAPASAILTFTFYYPALFFSTKYFLIHHRHLEFSSIVSQTIAFLLFVIAINIYRYVLFKVFRKKI